MSRRVFKRRTFADIEEQLPRLCDGYEDMYGRHADLLITMLGFEDRCGKACEFLVKDGWKMDKCLIGQYDTAIELNERNRQRLSGVLGSLDGDVIWSERGAESLLRTLEMTLSETASNHPIRVVLDISVMSTSIILSVMRLLFRYPHTRLLALYVRAEVYGRERSGPGGNTILWSGRTGVNQVHFSVDFPGTTQPGLNDLIMVVPALDEGFRVEAALDFINPSYLTDPSRNVCLIVGESDREEGRAMTRELVESRYPDIPVRARISDKSIVDYMRALECIYEENRFSKNITIVHFGTKLQTLGLAMFCLMRPSVRVLSVEAATYDPDVYSRGAEDVQSIDFGKLGVVAHALESVDTIGLA